MSYDEMEGFDLVITQDNTDIDRHRYFGWNPFFGNPFSLFIFSSNKRFKRTER